jgi:hypothetical protein
MKGIDMPEQMTHRIRIKRGDFEIEVEGEKEFVEKKFQELIDSSPFPKISQPLTSPPKQVFDNTSKTLSLREFIDQFNTKAHMDYILLIAYYLEKYRSQESFTVTEIKGAYSEMREKLTNAGPFINQNVKKGYLMEAPSKEGVKKATYSLTRKGMQFIENGLTLPE